MHIRERQIHFQARHHLDDGRALVGQAKFEDAGGTDRLEVVALKNEESCNALAENARGAFLTYNLARNTEMCKDGDNSDN
jgi:hypothetical protein